MKNTAARRAAIDAYRRAVRGTGLRQDVTNLSTAKIKSLTREAEKYREAKSRYSRARKNYLRSKAGRGSHLPTVREMQSSSADTSAFERASRDVHTAAVTRSPKTRERAVGRIHTFVYRAALQDTSRTVGEPELPKVEEVPQVTETERPDEWLPQNEPGFDEAQAARDAENRARVAADAERYQRGKVMLNTLNEMIDDIEDPKEWKQRQNAEAAGDLRRLLDSVPEDVLMWNLANAPSEFIEDATVAINYGKGSNQHSQAMSAIYTIITGEIPGADDMKAFGAGAEFLAGFEDEELE